MNTSTDAHNSAALAALLSYPLSCHKTIFLSLWECSWDHQVSGAPIDSWSTAYFCRQNPAVARSSSRRLHEQDKGAPMATRISLCSIFHNFAGAFCLHCPHTLICYSDRPQQRAVGQNALAPDRCHA
ncbi:hypothetical protein B9G98_04250 [Wickerhamiella sorbophila]|uniref:Uncharacterized protein n=1 Tax=Wickerhamiella sorbophila TaxID=45607 RepID=A0A2T0FNR8_9ASCO|nr:hypothetical protein B9G98_04250 [Wickerhamiella sorbophila]PRT56630.1 hypothetical protein B9G98_04250 [Wickerhamiella sorbophila]